MNEINKNTLCFLGKRSRLLNIFPLWIIFKSY